MRYKSGDIITCPYPNDPCHGLILEKKKPDQSNPFRASLYPHGYYEMLILEDGSYRNWDADWVKNKSRRIA